MLGLGRLIEFLSLVLVVKGATFSHNSLLVCNYGVLVYRSSCYYSRGWNNTICRLLLFFFSRFNLVNEALMSITFFKRKYTFCCKREKISHSTFGKKCQKINHKSKEKLFVKEDFEWKWIISGGRKLGTRRIAFSCPVSTQHQCHAETIE